MASASASAAAAASTAASSASAAPAAAAAASASSRPMLAYSTRRVTCYEKLNLLGEGTYGSVYRARDKSTGDIVALKKIRPLKDKSGFPLTSVREVSLLQSVSHPHIIRLREMAVGRKAENIFLVFDYCQHDLATICDRMSRPFRESEVKRIMLQLLSAVDYLHRSFIVHRDLKLSNLLIDAEGKLQLADFGLARTFSNPLKEMTPKVVTLWYRSPELLLNSDRYHSAVDMWAIGCIFGELLRHRPLLPGTTESIQLGLICALLGSPHEKIWPGFGALAASATDIVSLPSQPYNNLSHEFPHLSEQGLDLLSRLLTYDPSKRITADKALRHAYFSEAPLPCVEELMPTFNAAAASSNADSSIQMPITADTVGGMPIASKALPPLPIAATSSKKRKHEPPPASDAAQLPPPADEAAADASKRGKRGSSDDD